VRSSRARPDSRETLLLRFFIILVPWSCPKIAARRWIHQ
jgi:hypothetical protein